MYDFGPINLSCKISYYFTDDPSFDSIVDNIVKCPKEVLSG